MALLVARHGATQANLDGVFVSRSDPPLAARGIADAERLGLRLACAGVTEILVSPAVRARQTADIVASRLDLVPRVEPLLIEVDFGAFEGLSRHEIAQGSLSSEFRAWESGGEGGGAEPLDGASLRARKVLTSLDLQEVVLLVTHGVLARLLIATSVLGLEPSGFRTLRLDPGGHATVVAGDGLLRLVGLQGHQDFS